MESGGECDECSSCEQSIYWNHFHSIHFCQILDAHFRTHLMIPQKFTDYARSKLQDKVSLKGPSGTTTWEVEVTTMGEMLFLRNGWTEFVNAFRLQQNDILIFKYNGNSCFSTLIFDQGTMCEKESSYFTKKCGHSRSGPENANQEKMPMIKEVVEEFPQDHSHDFEELELNPCKKPRKGEDFELIPLKKLQKDQDGPSPTSLEQPVIESNVPEIRNMRASYPDIDVQEATTVEERAKNPRKSWGWEPVILPSAVTKGQKKSPMKVPSTNAAENISITTVTEQQKDATLRMARKELTSDSFLAVMRPTCVYRVFYLNIPAAWISRHLAFKPQFVSLRTNGKMWPTKLSCRSNGLRGGFTVGWKAFALDNCLKESDVCVFKLASTPRHEPVILDVNIFHVPLAVKDHLP